MLAFLKEFIHSQLFGIILGAFLTGGFAILCDSIRFKREEKLEKMKEEYKVRPKSEKAFY